LRKYLKFILLFLVAVLLLWFFGRNLNWQEVGDSLRRANPWYLTLAVLGICFGYFLRAVRWQVLLAPITRSSIKELFATTTVGFAAVFFVGRAGEIVRPMWLPMRDRRVRPSAALVTIFIERVLDLASIICVFSLSLIWFKQPAGHETEFDKIKFVGNVMLAMTIAGFIALFIYHRKSRPIIAWAERVVKRKYIPGRVQYLLLSLMRQLAASLEILRSPKELFLSIFWTFALWMSIAVPTWLVILAFGFPMRFIDSTFVMTVASLGSLIPTPGGAAGAFHAATAGSLIFLNMDKDQAAAVSIIMHLIYFAPAVFFGLYYLMHGDISIERFRSLLSSENAEKEIESDSPDYEEEDDGAHVAADRPEPAN
jgi:glycosyltransferase 2 family protein